MDEKYHVKVTSRDSATVDDIALTPPQESKSTRRLIRPCIVNNAQDASASVQVTLMHQRKHKVKEDWQDVDAFNQATLKASEEVRFVLGATETWRLKEALNQLYAIGSVPQQDTEFIVQPASRDDQVVLSGEPRDILKALQDQYGEDVWNILGDLQSELLQTVALKKLNDQRRRVISAFKNALAKDKGGEAQWQKFFAANLWIFGYGLNFQILDLIEEQPHYGGKTMHGRGGQRGDYLLSTRAGARFTVIVDIKTPHALLVEDEPYRNKVHRVGGDVTGGVAQLQSYCRTWVVDGSRQEENRHDLEQENVSTYEPKSILVIGNTKQLSTTHKRASFEMFRRNLHNPEILTFDELLARDEFIVGGDDS